VRVSRHPHTASWWRLLLRALSYHRGQTIAVALVTALITAGAVFAPWYARMVDDTVTRDAFAVGEPGSTLRLTGSETVELDELLPVGTEQLFEDPIAGRTADIQWQSTNHTRPVEGGMMWRADICDHLVLIEGSCPEPPEADATRVPIAVSEADAEMYDVEVGDTLPEQNSVYRPVEFEVTGVYELEDETDPYWFEVVPTGRSGYTGPNLDIPVADLFVVSEAGVVFGSDRRRGVLFDEELLTRAYQDSLDLRVDAAAVSSAEVDRLKGIVAELRKQTDGNQALLVTSMDDTFDYLDRAWDVTATTMIVTAAQVGVLALAVLAMLVSVALIQRRPEVGLSRLRGRSFGSLVRLLAGQWTVVVLAGAALGVAGGFGAAALARSLWLSGPPPLSPPGWALASLVLAVAAAILLLVLMARPVVREPVPALLRSTGPRSAGPGDGRLLVDGALVTAAVCGLLVGLQSSDDSALVLLAPSLLAVAASVLLVRLLAWAAGRLSVRWLTRGHTTWALTGVQIARGRGTRLLLTVLCMTAAFLVFSTQLSTVAQDNRTHRAEVEAGAAAVGRTAVPPADVVAALDAVDPDRERATLVVSAAPSGDDALGSLYVEPAAFLRIAPGARDAAPASAWGAIEAPTDRRPELTGRRIRLTVPPHAVDADGGGGELVLHVDYVHPRGFLTSARLGEIPVTSDEPLRLEAPLSCARTCRLLGWSLDPDGAVDGEIELTDIATSTDGEPTPLDLGAGDDWSVLAEGNSTDATIDAGAGTLALRGASGGLPFALQHASVPATVPVVLARDHPAAADYEDPTVLSPEGQLLPISVSATAGEAIPRVIREHAVADVATVLRRGEYQLSGRTEVQLWYADGVDREALDAELAAHRVTVTLVDTVADYAAEHESSAEALTGEVFLPAGGLALLLGVLALVVSVAATWRARTRDLAALRMVGVNRRTLLRSACGMYLAIVVAATVTGVACGALGFVLAIKRTPLFTIPEPEIPLDLDPDLPTGLVVLGLILLVLTAASIACGRWLLGRSALHRIREAGE
jgi:ABC-type lipoprotein release transport system permease subunit